MFALTTTLCVCLLACVLICSASEGPLNITAEPGQTVTLTCRVTIKNPVTVVEWRRPDLKSGYVSFYRSGESDPDMQHLSFKNRVEMKDKHLKDGDVSVILKNVTINDTGTYECYVAEKGSSSQLITTINLTVTVSGDGAGAKWVGGVKDEHLGLVVGLSVVTVILIVSVVNFVICKKIKRLKKQNHKPPVEEATDPEL